MTVVETPAIHLHGLASQDAWDLSDYRCLVKSGCQAKPGVHTLRASHSGKYAWSPIWLHSWALEAIVT
jgi:hypothetical protein